jgi:anti-sigma factor RsiW
MSSLFERHPDRDLVRYLDGELSARRQGSVERHLEACGRCRADLEELKNTVAECARYKNVLSAQMPEAPQPWRDLYRDFSRIDESLANPSLLVRLARPLVHAGAPRWAFVTGLAVLIVLLSLNQLRQTPSVLAATILRKAVAVSQRMPRLERRIRVRTSRRQEFTRSTGALPVAQAADVAALFQAAHYDWNDPLSAQAFQQWRDEQVHKTDAVTTVPNPQSPSLAYTQIKTVSADGELQSATITFNRDDYRPLQELLQFRDNQWVELSEISEGDIAGGTPGRHIDVPVRAAEPPSRPAASVPGSSASMSDELQVLVALSAIGADLGDGVDVVLTDGKVMVTGREGIPPQRQEKIRASLADLPHVALEFSPAHPVSIPPEAAVAGGTAVSAPVSPMQERLEKQLGGHAGFDRFNTQLLDLDDAAMQRVYALHRLAEKFPQPDEAQLNSSDVNLLHELSRNHAAKLAENVSAMERILVPTLGALGGTAASLHPAADYPNWQAAAEDAYRSAQRVDVLVSQVLGMTADKASARTLPSELITALKDLEGNLAECRKLLEAK